MESEDIVKWLLILLVAVIQTTKSGFIFWITRDIWATINPQGIFPWPSWKTLFNYWLFSVVINFFAFGIFFFLATSFAVLVVVYIVALVVYPTVLVVVLQTRHSRGLQNNQKSYFDHE